MIIKIFCINNLHLKVLFHMKSFCITWMNQDQSNQNDVAHGLENALNLWIYYNSLVRIPLRNHKNIPDDMITITVLSSNSRFLGPGISRELEIVNWKNWVFPSNSRYHYGGYRIGIPLIGRNLNEYESVNLQDSELRGRELGGNTVLHKNYN